MTTDGKDLTTTGDIGCTNDGRGGGVNNDNRDGRRGGVNDNIGRPFSIGRGVTILRIGPVYIVTGTVAAGGGGGVGLDTTTCGGVGPGTAATPPGDGADVASGTATRDGVDSDTTATSPDDGADVGAGTTARGGVGAGTTTIPPGDGADVGAGTAARGGGGSDTIATSPDDGADVGAGTTTRGGVDSDTTATSPDDGADVGTVRFRRSTRSTTAIKADASSSWNSNSFARARAIIFRARLELGKWGSVSGGRGTCRVIVTSMTVFAFGRFRGSSSVIDIIKLLKF